MRERESEIIRERDSCGGQVVNLLALYYDDPSSYPAEV